MENLTAAFLLTLMAGLSTGIGSCIAFMNRSGSRAFLSFSLGFSAGVMIYVSMTEMMQEARAVLSSAVGAKTGSAIATASFFFGMLITAALDRVIPAYENPHRVRMPGSAPLSNAGLMRTGVLTAVAIALHNLPEGLATFVSAMRQAETAIPIAAAIALHNIPEGMAVSVPIYEATGSRSKAFRYSFMSGLAEPLGALLGWLVLKPIMNDIFFGMIFAAVAGIMVFISLDELLPAAREYGKHHTSIYGLTAGMAVMAISILTF